MPSLMEEACPLTTLCSGTTTSRSNTPSAIDTGGERFGFVLPEFDVPQGQSGHFDTVGVYEKFSGPDSFPKVPPSWRGIELHGTAQTVIVPL